MKREFNVSKRILKKTKLLAELENKFSNASKFKKFHTKAIIGDSKDVDFEKLGKQLSNKNFDLQPAEEALIELFGRPVLEIKNDSFDINEPDLDFWKDILKAKRPKLKKIIPSVGRIELDGHPSMDWVGTGWLFRDDYIITNRHVAKEFARRSGSSFVFNRTFWDEEYKCGIDFKEEFKNPASITYRISEVVHIAPDSGPDIAILKIAWDNNNQKFKSLELASKVIEDETIAIIGYPAKDFRTNMPEEQLRVFSGIFNKKRLAVGEIDYLDPNNQFFIHDCSTLGGNSGSPVLDIETQKVYGLHFGGKEGQGNFAIPSGVISQIFDQAVKKASIVVPASIPIGQDDEERVTKEQLKNRKGYNTEFLNQKVAFPILSASLKNESIRHAIDEIQILNYINYSVIMSNDKRLALVTAVNIDGAKWRHVTRGNDVWRKDPRINRNQQVGNELYKHNKLDRGHLVRRLDPAWGNTFKAAEKASLDTFFYTNCAPQHKNLNQKIWLGLEEHILSKTKEHGLKVSVFNGPVFSDDDMFYRDVQIPESFWKVVITNKGKTKIHATAYLLSQKKWLNDIEFVFGEYQTFQVPISFIEQKTGLKFNGSVTKSDPLVNQNESVFGTSTINQIDTLDAIILK